MKALLQRVSHGSVSVAGECLGEIGRGLVVLLGVGYDDTPREAARLAEKIAKLRIFDDEEGVMNRSLVDVGGEALLISQFTLMANCRKGNRPSYIDAARGEISEPLYEEFVSRMRAIVGSDSIKVGKFGADMLVSIANDGPVTIMLDTDTL